MALIDTLSDAQRKAVRDLFASPRVTVRDIPRSTMLALQRRGFIEADPNVMIGLTQAGRALIEEQLCHANLAADFAVDDRVERSIWRDGNAEPYTHEWKSGAVVGIGKSRLTIRYDDGTTGRAEAYHVRKVAADAHQATNACTHTDDGSVCAVCMGGTATPYTYTTIGEGEQRLIIARHTDGDVIVIRMDSPTRWITTSVKGDYDHEREVNEWFVAQMRAHLPNDAKIETVMSEDHAPVTHENQEAHDGADANFERYLQANSEIERLRGELRQVLEVKNQYSLQTKELTQQLDAARKAHAEAEAFAQQEHASYNDLWEAVRKAYCDVFELQMWNATALQAVDLLARAAKEGKTLHNAVRSAHGEVYDGAWQEGQSDVDLVQMLARSATGHKTRAIEKAEANAAVYRQALIEAQESLDTEGVRSESIDTLLVQSGAGADLLDELLELRRDNSELRQNIANLNTVIEATNTRLVDERQRYVIPYKDIAEALGNPNDLLAEVNRLRGLEADMATRKFAQEALNNVPSFEKMEVKGD